MRITRVWGQDIYSFKKLEFDLTNYQGGTTMILGKNLDQKTANGAGKTSLLKAIFFFLYGEDLAGSKKVPKANVVRRGSKTGMAGGLDFEHNGDTYSIVRSISYKSKKPIILYEIDGKEVKLKTNDIFFSINGKPLLGEGPSDTQKNILNKIKISPKLFLSSILTAQKSNSQFLSADDTEKKKLLSELLDLTKYEKGFQKIKDDIKKLKEKLNKDTMQMDNLLQQSLTAKEDLDQAIKDEKNYHEREKEELNDLQNRIKKTNQALNEDREKLKKLVIPSISEDSLKEENELNSKINNLDAQIDKEDGVLETKNKIENAINNIEVKSKEFTDEINEIIPRIESKTKEKNELLKQVLEVKNLSETQSKVEALDNIYKEFQLKEKSFNSLKKDIENLQGELAKNKLAQQENKALIEEIQDNSACPTCERKFEENSTHLKKSLQKFLDEKDNLSKVGIKLESSIKEQTVTLGEYQTFLESNKDCQEKLDQSTKEVEEIKLNVEKNKSIKSQALRINQEIQEIKNKEIKLKEQLEKFPEEIKILKEKENKTLENIEKLKMAKKLVKQYQEKLNKLKTQNADLKIAMEQKNYLEKDIKRNEEAIVEYTNKEKDLLSKKEDNSFVKRKETLTKRLKDLDLKSEVLKKDIKKKEEDLKYLNFWKVGFSPTGIRSFIADDVIQLLNQKTQDNLDDLFDGALQVYFDPETTDGKGVISNKISTKFYLNGEECRWDELSGGEQQRATLATELALNEVAEDYSGTIFNVKFLDEPFDGMDDIGQQKSLTLFNRLASSKDFFGIISHSPNFQSLCPHKVHILKKNKVSKVVSAEEFMNADAFSEEHKMNIPDDSSSSKSEGNKFDYDL